MNLLCFLSARIRIADVVANLALVQKHALTQEERDLVWRRSDQPVGLQKLHSLFLQALKCMSRPKFIWFTFSGLTLNMRFPRVKSSVSPPLQTDVQSPSPALKYTTYNGPLALALLPLALLPLAAALPAAVDDAAPPPVRPVKPMPPLPLWCVLPSAPCAVGCCNRKGRACHVSDAPE